MTTLAINSSYLKTVNVGKYIVDHRTYGGEITLFDFEGHHTLTTMARKIKTAECFDRDCMKRTMLKLNNQKRDGE